MEIFKMVCREWIAAYSKTISPISKLPDEAQLERVSLELGPPYHGTVILRIRTESGQGIEIPLCDAHPPFLRILEWLERLCGPESCCDSSQENLRIDCYNHIYTLTMAKVGFQERAGQEQFLCPVSLLTVHRSGNQNITLGCFCKTKDFITEFYCSIRHSFSIYAARYNNPQHWRTERDYHGKHTRSFSETLKRRFRSKKIDLLIASDKSCQNRILPLHHQISDDMEYWEFYGGSSNEEDDNDKKY